MSGCDLGAVPPEAARGERDAQQVRSPKARYQIDLERNRVWSLTQEGAFVIEASRPQNAVAVTLPGWLTVAARFGCLPDLALGPKGEAVITSNIVPTLWRVDPDTLAVTVHPLLLDADTDKDVGFSGLAYSPQHEAFFATSYVHGSLWRIDASLERAQKIPLSAPVKELCGVAVRPQSSQQSLRRMADACVLTLHGGRSVIFAPGWRAAYVSTAPCADGSFPSKAVWPRANDA
jgi:hypothetical protein